VGKLFLLFTAVPLLDLWLLLAIGDVIGFWPTVGLVLLTGFAGATLARIEGLRVLGAWRAALAAGRLPEEGVLSGVLVLVGAVLLVTPGVLTDVVGLALLVPASRRLAARGLRAWLARQIRSGHVRVMSARGGGPRPGGSPASREVVDVTPRTRDETP
jgi:UPF0716 protein FxsA